MTALRVVEPPSRVVAEPAIPAPTTDRNWRTWHLHVDSFDPQLLEAVVVRVVTPTISGLVRTRGAIAPGAGGAGGDDTRARLRWFFLRYWQRGPHVRLRIADLDDEVAGKVTDELATRLLSVTSATLPEERIDEIAYAAAAGPLAAVGEGAGPLDAGRLRRAGVHADTYAPETQRYGGPELIAVSEALFHSSSIAVARVCAGRPGRAGALLDAVEAMAATASAWPGDPVELLAAVQRSWAGWLDAASAGSAAGVDAAAAAYAAKLSPIAADLQGLVEGAPSRWAPWTDGLALAARLWVDDLGGRRAREIFGSHLHMTQNRLGLGAGREAYVAAALLHLLSGRVTHEATRLRSANHESGLP